MRLQRDTNSHSCTQMYNSKDKFDCWLKMNQHNILLSIQIYFSYVHFPNWKLKGKKISKRKPMRTTCIQHHETALIEGQNMKPSKHAIEEWEIRYSSIMYIPCIMEGKRLSRTRISIGTSIFQVYYDLGLTALQHHSPSKKSGDYKNRQ